MTAILMCGKLLLGTYQVRRPMRKLRFSVNSCINTYVNTASSLYETTAANTDSFEFVRNELIFGLVGQVDCDAFEYQLEGEMTNPKYAISMYNHIEELEEPDEATSLRKLVSKMRATLEAKELLIRYYNS